MKLLVLTSRLPYPIEKGDKLRIYHQIRELSAHHEIILCALVEEPTLPEHLEHLSQFCSRIYTFPLTKAGIVWHSFKALCMGKPLQVAYFYRKSIHQQIKEVVAEHQPRVVFCQLIRMAEYAKNLGIPAALDYMDCFSAGMKRQAVEGNKWISPLYHRESRLLSQYQLDIYPFFQFHSIISAQDRKLLDKEEKLNIYIQPNGIDTNYFSPLTDRSASYDLTFVGNMGYFPNIRAVLYLVQKVLPLVWQQHPEVSLLISGARPHPDVQKLGRDPRVVISGWVSDIRNSYEAGKVFVAPIFTGSGQQNKILEAMSMQKACITTEMVNNAIQAEDGREIQLANDPEAFAAKIMTLLSNEGLRNELGEKGRVFVQQKYSWSHSVSKLEAWISSLKPTLRKN